MAIPVGEKISVWVEGSTVKAALCEMCSTEYVYKVERTGTGRTANPLFLNGAGAERRAQEKAEADLERTLAKAVDPVACPVCGWYQQNMVDILKRKKFWMPAIWSCIAGALLLAFGIAKQHVEATAAGLALAAAGFAAGMTWANLHNPNAGHAGAGTCHPGNAGTSRGVKLSDFQAARGVNRPTRVGMTQSSGLDFLR